MKNLNWSSLAAALLLMSGLNSWAMAAGPEVIESSGDVVIPSPTASIAVGDKVITGPNGKLTLQVKSSGLRIVALADSELSYQGVTDKGAENFKVTKGRVSFSVVPGNHLDVETPHLVASVRGTEFSTTVGGDDSMLSVSEGRVAVQDSKGVSGMVTRGWSAVATSAGFTSATTAHLPMMSSPKAVGEPNWSERAEKAQGNERSEAAKTKSDNANSRGNSGSNSSSNSSGNSSSNSSGNSSSNSGSGRSR